ncbi:MAG: glutamate 5-kinase [Firmicutes bacterium]|nr:glutamate 5-kinase [Bacillota bacterium]
MFHNVKRVVVKVGTSTITYPTYRLNLDRMERLVREIADLTNRGMEVVLVTSGAISAGLSRLGFSQRPATLPAKQAVAAVGQGLLMQVYEKLFAEYGQVVAQVLLTREDLRSRERYLNSRHTLLELLRYRVVPIVNENDTVAVEEIKFGDNDTLSALVAALVGADLLLVLSDVDGVNTADPRQNPDARLVDVVTSLDELAEAAGGAGSSRGTGGMVTKFQAARIACRSGIPMVIAHGGRDGVIHAAVTGADVGTLFLPEEERLNSRKRWLAFYHQPLGEIFVDDGAKTALMEAGKSLLPIGITRVSGAFAAGDLVTIRDGEGKEIGRGLSNYSAQEVELIKGHHSEALPQILGRKDYDEVIHRDNLVLFPEE